MKKWLIRIVIVLLALLVVGYACRNFIARRSVEVAVQKMTGFPLEIGAVNVGILNGTLQVDNLKLSNPAEFHGGTFVDLPLFKVDYVTMSMISGSPHIKELDINVEQVVVVTNEKGEMNAQVIQDRISPAKPASTSGTEKKQEPTAEAKKQKYQVDLLRIHIGTVIKRTYNKDGKPSDIKLVVNTTKELKDINESKSIPSLVSQVIFGQLGDVAGVAIKGVNDAFKGAGDAVKGASDTLQKTGKGLFDGIKKAIPQK